MSAILKRGWGGQNKASNLVLARAYVKFQAPYLASTLFGLIPMPMPGLLALAGGPIAVTERLVLYYEPDWVEQEEVIVLATGLAHECLHVQLNHVIRGKSYPDKKRFNRAGDLFINGIMRDVKRVKKSKDGSSAPANEPVWKFPEWALMPEQYGFAVGLTADEYYRLLEEFEKAGKTPKEPGSSPGGAGGGGGEGPGIMQGCCGGVAGNPLSKELENKYNHEKGRSESDVVSIAKATAKAIDSYMKSSEGRGTMPGNWSELVKISEKEFEVPWRQKLAKVLRHALGAIRAGGLDYSIRRPSRRSYLRGIILPGLIGYEPNVWFIVDSSGSMGSEQLADASKICADVLKQTGVAEAWWMEADIEHKREPLRIAVRDLVSMEIRGRGGTDFRPAINYVASKRPKPHVVIYITDGEGPAPRMPPPGIHFIWVIVPSSWAKIPARWGDMVILTDHLPEHTRYDDLDDDDDD